MATNDPSTSPSGAPSNPSANPSSSPSAHPTANPSNAPSKQSSNPTVNPTANPSANPSSNPSSNPTRNPTANPSSNPSLNPSVNPSSTPSAFPVFSSTWLDDSSQKTEETPLSSEVVVGASVSGTVVFCIIILYVLYRVQNKKAGDATDMMSVDVAKQESVPGPGVHIDTWNADDVYGYLSTVNDGDLIDLAKLFREEEVRGRALANITDDDLLRMGVSLGNRLQFRGVREKLVKQFAEGEKKGDDEEMQDTDVIVQPQGNSDQKDGNVAREFRTRTHGDSVRAQDDVKEMEHGHVDEGTHDSVDPQNNYGVAAAYALEVTSKGSTHDDVKEMEHGHVDEGTHDSVDPQNNYGVAAAYALEVTSKGSTHDDVKEMEHGDVQDTEGDAITRGSVAKPDAGKGYATAGDETKGKLMEMAPMDEV
eukprot:994792_1